MDDETSRLHAVLERVGGEWTVVDDGLSQNGAFVGPARHHRPPPAGGRRRLRCGAPGSRSPTRVGGRRGRLDREVAGAGERRTDHRRPDAGADRALPPLRGGDAFAVPATNKQIADELFLSVDAVKSHLRPLFEKFALGDLPQNAKRAALVERALMLGIVTERDLRAQSPPSARRAATLRLALRSAVTMARRASA